MPTTEVTINNKPLSTMGVAMLSGAYAALLTPPSLKEFVENDDPTQNGIDIIVPDSPVVNERDVTLTFLIKGTSQEAFLSNYAAFVAELHKGYDIFLYRRGRIIQIQSTFYLKRNCRSVYGCSRR